MRRSALALLLACLLLVAGVSALDGYDYYQTIGYAACDQEVYQQDIVIHRTTGTAYNETAGGLEIWHIFVGDHCREDYGDIRFTNSTGAELAYYLWPDYDSSSARFTVRLEGADVAGTLTIHYGNVAAATTSDGDAVYLFFDQFDGAALDTTKWDQAPKSTVTVSGGAVSVKGIFDGGRFYGIKGKQSFDTQACRLEIQCLAIPDRYGHIGWADHRSNLDSNRIMLRVGSQGVREGVVKKGGATTYFTWTWPAPPKQYGFARSGASALYYIDGVLSKTYTSSTYVPTAPLSPVINTNGQGGPFIIDYVLVRAYSATPPAALTFSGERETAAPPLTAFTATPTAGLAPLTVQFTDTSTGTPTAWSWTFGDGGTSSEQNPQHTYTAPGLYTVTLIATNEYGSDEETKTDYITVYGPVTAQFTANITSGIAPLTVQFTDLSTGGPTSWLWDFGDGNTSTEQNPQHTYTTAGAHTVTLTASHPYDSDTETKTSYITVAVLQPFPGLPLIPRDLTGNGLYTDINGNNRLDYNDLTVFFQNLAWAKTAQPTSCFDFNGNGWLDYNDVIILFSIIMEEHP